jgi:hypothetical protein
VRHLALLLALFACSDDAPRRGTMCVRDFSRVSEATRFIVECAAAANPKSDEEGEDLVAQCARTADAWFCTTVPAVWSSAGGFGHWERDLAPLPSGCAPVEVKP